MIHAEQNIISTYKLIDSNGKLEGFTKILMFQSFILSIYKTKNIFNKEWIVLCLENGYYSNIGSFSSRLVI